MATALVLGAALVPLATIALAPFGALVPAPRLARLSAGTVLLQSGVVGALVLLVILAPQRTNSAGAIGATCPDLPATPT
jgi:hypothetical protein